LVTRHERLVFAVASSYRLSETDVGDVFQEVFTALVRGLPRLRDARTLVRWLSSTTERIARATALRRRREQALEESDPQAIESLPADQPEVGAELETLEEQALVRLALDRRLAEPGRREVEEHLARPCAPCRECVRELGALLHLMRHDRAPLVPEALRERALAAFAPIVRPSRVAPLLEQLARLVFDSMAAPLPAHGGAVRRSRLRHAVGEARRLGFALGEGRL